MGSGRCLNRHISSVIICWMIGHGIPLFASLFMRRPRIRLAVLRLTVLRLTVMRVSALMTRIARASASCHTGAVFRSRIHDLYTASCLLLSMDRGIFGAG